MKKILFSLLSGLALLSLLAASAQAQTTPVFFSLVSLTGSVNNRTITLVPDEYENPVVFGTNLAVLFPIQLQPVHGQVTTNLVPWGYSLTVDGWPRSVHIDVPYSTNVVPIISLINTNRFTPLNLYSTIVIGTNGILVWQTNGITTIDGSAFEAAGTCSNTFTAFTNNVVTFNSGVFLGGGDNGNIYGPIPSYLDDYSWNIQSSGIGDFQGLNVGDVIIRPDHVSGINPGDYCSFPSIYARNGGLPGGAMLTNQFVIGDLSLASNLPAATLTGLATNTVIPISAHITNHVVYWTSP